MPLEVDLKPGPQPRQDTPGLPMSFTTTLASTSNLPHTPQKRRPQSSNPFNSSTTSGNIWSWLVSSPANSIAPCFVRDVFAMKANEARDEDYYWLGRVPCRTVHLTGILVGLSDNDEKKRIVYTLDDGTDVIDCHHKLPKNTPYLKPAAFIGDTVRIIGRVLQYFETRIIHVDSVERCKSPNDELHHWALVQKLHDTSYSSSEPFMVPALTQPVPSTPIKVYLSPERPGTPSAGVISSSPTKYQTASSSKAHANHHPQPSLLVMPSPATTVSSPAKSHISSPQKLRHPSKLHSKDLTTNTFRIYVKHYMDQVIHTSLEDFDDDDFDDFSTTPTKRKPSNDDPFLDNQRTPRATRSKPYRKADRKGFTLSYLRRVPELSLAARRVVEAEIKRRARADRKKDGENQAPKPKRKVDNEPPGRKMKRLFTSTIIQLVKEGSIVLWDGPVYRTIVRNESQLWRTTDLTMMSTASNSSHIPTQFDDVEEVSDPEDPEDSYLPLTPSYLAEIVEPFMARERRAWSTAELLRRLKKDDRWMALGEWDMKDALDHLADQGRIERSGEKWLVSRL